MSNIPPERKPSYYRMLWAHEPRWFWFWFVVAFLLIIVPASLHWPGGYWWAYLAVVIGVILAVVNGLNEKSKK